jgi:aminopeptidase N
VATLQTITENLPAFYKNVLEIWCKVKNDIPIVNYDDVVNECMWFNKLVTIENKSFFWKNWYLNGIYKVKDLLDADNKFKTAENMTDEFEAFRILSRIDPGTRTVAAKAFYKKWQHDKLVLDKWFAVQAASCLEDTLDIVKNLIGHPDFSMTNPNKVRALIYIFAIQNPVNFHRSDGKGYTFISNQILQLDKINHQIAARLASCFNQWKKYDGARQALMKKALGAIMADQALSKNVFEIVSRAQE